MKRVQIDDFIAGWIGGATSVIVGHPFDTVKTRLQAGQGYKNTLQCILTVYRKENVTGFFKGLSFPLASITLYNSVVFGVFSNTQRLLNQLRYGTERHESDLLTLVLSSMTAGLLSVGIGAPVDLVKIRLQMQTQSIVTENFNLAGNVSLRTVSLHEPSYYRGPIHCISTIVQNEGISGLYRGAGAMVLRDIPGYTAYFVPYTFICGWLTPGGDVAPNCITIWLAGGLAGSISWVTATPADVIKSRLQADKSRQRKYKGITHCIMESYRAEGLQVFFRGAAVNTIRGFPMSATMFLSYELSLKLFRGL
ncbi:solute carrier family 25 member 48 [Erpetoichthys calabaricus]|uniref:Solute carrier family 25 member 48 n=1 Tax=Erpetoichthys calabaricus TaxID=27687 RepID=A0A8C4SI81_ERPCA|nr:solute carrier family 25 member 48 [Erpetoichthys calabaricus]